MSDLSEQHSDELAENEEVQETVELAEKLPEPFFTLSGSLDEENNTMLLDFLGACLEVESQKVEKIKIYVNTPGGCSDTTHGLCDLVEALDKLGVVVEITGVGKVMSAGVLLVACGSKGFRKATKRTRFMIHPVQADAPPGSAHDYRITTKEIDRHLDDYVTRLVECSTTEDKEHLRKFLNGIIEKNTDYYFSSQEALELGFIDSIV